MFASLVNELTGLCLKTYGSQGDSKCKVLFYGMTNEYFFNNRITKDKIQCKLHNYTCRPRMLILPMNMEYIKGIKT